LLPFSRFLRSAGAFESPVFLMTSQDSHSGQPHDRLGEDFAEPQQTALDRGNVSKDAYEITVYQRMMSATLGSLLTSLLVTPLDVVRVRLQSQAPTITSRTTAALASVPTSPSPLNPSARFSAMGNLGVTACCREVFWANNAAPVCFAGTSAGSAAEIQAMMHTTDAAGHCAVEETQKKAFNTTWDGLQKIARNEGITSLWRGLSPTLVMAVPANVIYFSAYDMLRYGQNSPIRKIMSDNYSPLAAGSIARLSAALVVSPIEMFKTRMQAAPGGQKDIVQQTMSSMKDLVSTQGYTGLWRGLTLTMWRDVPFSALYWWGYETLRNQISSARDTTRGRTRDGPETSITRSESRNREGHAVTLVDSFAAGATSGAIASIVTTPFDVGKTRQQVTVHAADRRGSAKAAVELLPEDRSMPRFLMHIFREEGFKGLFKGWIPRTMKVAPACAIMISSYEVGKKLARSSNEKRAAA